MIEGLPPGLILILGGMLIPLLLFFDPDLPARLGGSGGAALCTVCGSGTARSSSGRNYRPRASPSFDRLSPLR